MEKIVHETAKFIKDWRPPDLNMKFIDLMNIQSLADKYFPTAVELFAKAQREECFKAWLNSPSPYTFQSLIKDRGTDYYETIRDYIINAPIPKPVTS